MNNSVQKAFDIINIISTSQTGLGITDVSKKLGLAKSTVFNILHTLVENDLLEESDWRHSKYQLGSNLCRLGFQYLAKHDLLDIARARLTQLRDDIGLTIFMAIQNKLDMVYVLKLESSSEIQLSAKSGTVSPILASGLGKAAMAATSDERIRALATQDMFSHSNDPAIHDLPSLLDYVHLARDRGYVADRGADQAIRIQSVAVPILNADYSMAAAISAVSLQETTTHDHYMELASMTIQAAIDISKTLGFVGSRLLNSDTKQSK